MALQLNTAFRRSGIGNLGQTGYLALLALHPLWRQATRCWCALDYIVDPEITDLDTQNLRPSHIKQHGLLLDLHLVGRNVLLVLWGQYLLRILHGQDKLLTQPFCLAMCCLIKRLVSASVDLHFQKKHCYSTPQPALPARPQCLASATGRGLIDLEH